MKRLILLILLIPLISASPGFSIQLKPHYYLDSQEILVYDNSTPFTGFSLDVVGRNLNNDSRIVNLRITKISSELFEKQFSNKTEILISGQEKVLWSSEVIDTTQIKNTSLPLIIGVLGRNEVTGELFYVEGKYNLNLNNPKEESNDFFKSIGNFIWDGNYQIGLFIGLVLIFTSIFVWQKVKMKRQVERNAQRY